MNVPNAATLRRIDGITDFAVDTIRGMIAGKYNPFEVSGDVRRWCGQCYHTPDRHSQLMVAINELLDCHGVESIDYQGDRANDFSGTPRFAYCNTGDSYAATVCYSYARDRFIVCGWADLVGG